MPIWIAAISSAPLQRRDRAYSIFYVGIKSGHF
jgi:hypothetical protein